MQNRRLPIIAVLLAFSAPAQDEDKVSRTVRRLAEQSPTVAVFVIGEYQPQQEVAGRWDQVLGRQVDAEQQALDRLSGQPFVIDSALERASARRDQAVTGLRGEVAGQVQREVAPQQDRIAALLARLGATGIRPFHVVNMVAAEVPSSALETIVAESDVARVVSNQRREFHLDISTQAMHASDLWLEGITGKGEAVGVLDSGIRSGHDAFQGKEIVHKPFVDGALRLLDKFDARHCLAEKPETGEDKVGHGTHVAGIVASGGTRAYPTVRGVGRGVGTIYNFKVGVKLDPELCEPAAIILDEDWIAALQYAVTQTPVRIFNMSFGGGRGDDQDADLIADQIADDHNAILVISAGNSGPGPRTVASPGNAYNSITVASRDDKRTADPKDDTISEFSSRGPTGTDRYKPDIAAPGARISSMDAFNTSGLVDLSGTSMAAPHIAGAVALMGQAGVRDLLGVKALLLNSSDHTGWRDDRGWGFANLQRAWELRDHILRSELTPGRSASASRYWRIRLDKPFQATMVWNRHIGLDHGKLYGSLRELDLYLFDRATGAVVAKSDLWGQNVEQVSTSQAGEVVLKVAPATTAFAAANRAERFAISMTQSGLVPMAGPSLAVSCAQEGRAAADGEFAIECTARNTGDLAIWGVRGPISVPVGFRSSGPIDYGTLAPGAQAVGRYRVYPGPDAKDYSGFQASLTATSFGETLAAASQSLTIPVVAAALPVLTASSASVTFNHRVGGPAPEPQTISVIANTPLGVVVHIPDAPWLGTSSVLSGVAPLSLRLVVNPTGLTAGAYHGRVVVNGNSSQGTLTIPVALNVTGDGVSARETRTARIAPAFACAAPTWTSYFTYREDRVVFWYALGGVLPGDRIRVDWVAPAGFVYAASPERTVAEAGDLCGSTDLAVAGKPVATMYGSWQARLTVNGKELASTAFIVTRVTVESWTLSTGSPEGAACPDSAPITSFTFSDPRVTAWLKVGGASEGDRYQVTWNAPDGSAFHTQFFPALTTAGPACLPATLPLQGANQPVSLPTGRWTVTGYWNGAVVAAQQFVLR